MAPERLQKILATAGVASRRGAEKLIADGRVTVDGRVATVGQSVEPGTVFIAVDGRPVGEASALVHLVVHKPMGVTSTTHDRHAARTVLDLVPTALAGVGRLYPVGRLDQDSEGLLLLTNDGPWSERVLHPRFGVEREYAIGLVAPLTTDQVAALRAGIDLDEGLAVVGHLRRQTPVEDRRLAAILQPAPPALAWYRATLEQGWKRQLRRMLAATGSPVSRLVRVRIGTVRLDEMRSGAIRPLSAAEIRSLGAGRTTGERTRRPPAGGDPGRPASPGSGRSSSRPRGRP